MSSPDLQSSIRILLSTCKNFGDEETTRKLITNLFNQEHEDPLLTVKLLVQELAVTILHPSPQPTVTPAVPPKPFHSQSFVGTVPMPQSTGEDLLNDDESTPLTSPQVSVEDVPYLDDLAEADQQDQHEGDSSPLSDKICAAVNSALALAESELKYKAEYSDNEEEDIISSELISTICKNVINQLNLVSVNSEEADDCRNDLEDALAPYFGQSLSENHDALINEILSLLSDSSYHLILGGLSSYPNLNSAASEADHFDSLIYNTNTEEDSDKFDKKKSLTIEDPVATTMRAYQSPTSASSSTPHRTPVKHLSPNHTKNAATLSALQPPNASPIAFNKAGSRTPPPRGVTATPNSARPTRINYDAIAPDTPAWLIPKSPLDALFRKGYGGIGQNDLKEVINYVDDDYYQPQEDEVDSETVDRASAYKVSDIDKPALGENLYGGSAKYEEEEDLHNESCVISSYDKEILNFPEQEESEEEDFEDDEDEEEEEDEEDEEEEGEEFEINSLDAQACNTTAGMTIRSGASSTGFPQSDEELDTFLKKSPKKTLKEQLLGQDSEYLQPDDLPFGDPSKGQLAQDASTPFFSSAIPPTASGSTPGHHLMSDSLLKTIQDSYNLATKNYVTPKQSARDPKYLSASQVYGYDYDENTIGTSVDSEKYQAAVKKSPSKSPTRIRQIKKSEKAKVDKARVPPSKESKEEVKRPSSAKPTQICREGLGGVSVNEAEATANILNIPSRTTGRVSSAPTGSSMGGILTSASQSTLGVPKKKKVSKLSTSSRLLEGTSASRIRQETREKHAFLVAEEKKLQQQLAEEKKLKKNSFGTGR